MTEIKEKINKEIEIINKYTKEIMELIDQKDELTQSDLQGVVMGIVIKLITEVKNDR